MLDRPALSGGVCGGWQCGGGYLPGNNGFEYNNPGQYNNPTPIYPGGCPCAPGWQGHFALVRGTCLLLMPEAAMASVGRYI